jgi:hypothetical protein
MKEIDDQHSETTHSRQKEKEVVDKAVTKLKAKKSDFKVNFHQSTDDPLKWEDERRSLRHELHDISDSIDANQEKLSELHGSDWDRTRTALNINHQKISHTREASYDAQIMHKLSLTMRKRVSKLEAK